MEKMGTFQRKPRPLLKAVSRFIKMKRDTGPFFPFGRTVLRFINNDEEDTPAFFLVFCALKDGVTLYQK